MRKAILFIICVLTTSHFIFGNDVTDLTKKDPDPGFFVPWIMNSGQFEEGIAFLKSTNVVDIWILRNRDIVYNVASKDGKRIRFEERILSDFSAGMIPKGNIADELKINYIGSSYQSGSSGIEAGTCRQVDYGYISKGIQLQLDARFGNVEKLLIINPGSDVGQVRFELLGINSMAIDDHGQLVLLAGGQEVRFTRPVAWQLDAKGVKEPVEVAYLTDQAKGNFLYGFKAGAYDQGRTLYIDPLISSSYFGGSQKEVIQQIRVGSNKQIYIAGVTESPNLFSVGTFDNTYNGNMDVFAAVFSHDLTSLLRMTYLGGTRKDSLGAMVLDKNNRMYLVGTTASSNFPVTANAFSSVYVDAQTNVSDIFVACLNSKIDTLISSTFLGSDREDAGNSIDINKEGHLIIAGMSAGKMPEIGPQWQTYTTGLVFAKMDSKLENVLATNSIGAFGKSRATDIGVDSSGQVFVTGYTKDTEFPVTPGSFSQHLMGKNDGFVLRVKNDLTQVLAGTYIGGFEDDYAYTLMVDTLQNVYLAGETRSVNFPVTQNAYDGSFSNQDPLYSDGFICMMDSLLKKMISGTFFGGPGNQAIFDISRDSTFSIVFAGYTDSGSIPRFCYSFDDGYNGGEDAFLGIFSEKLQQLKQTTFLGGSQNERALCLEIGEKDVIYVGGTTVSSDFPTQNGYDGTYNGGERDGFLGLYTSLSKLEPCCSEPVFPEEFAVNQPTELILQWTEAWGATGYMLSIGTAEGVFDILHQKDVGANTSYLIEDLPCGKTIFVYIQPYNEFLTNLYCDYFTFSTVKPYLEEQLVDICKGESYFWRGQYYDQTGDYVIEEDNGTSCPDIYKLHLSVHKIYEFTTIHEMCYGDTLYWQGDVYTKGGYFSKKYETVFGCDSIFMLDLWVYPQQLKFDSLTICAGDTIIWNGKKYFEPGDYICIKTDQNGCDKIHHLHLTIDLQIIKTNKSICEGTIFTWHGLTYSETGEYEFIAHSDVGCDTTYYLNLVVEPNSYVYDTMTLCHWDLAYWHGIIVYEAGDYTYVEEDEEGCTTFHYLHLIIETQHIHEYVEICEGDSYSWFGDAYEVAGDYDHRIFMPVGCDTTYFLHLTVIPTAVVFDTLSICNLDIYCWHGVPIYEEGDYSILAEHVGSCDTLFNLNVSFYSEFMHYEDIVLCAGDTLQWHGMEITGSGNYQWIDYSFESCDTIYHVQVDLVEINTTLTTEGEKIFAVFEPEASYQWFNCDDFSPIEGATDPYYEPANCDHMYAVLIEKGDCSEMSACICLEGANATETNQAGVLKVFPNPSQGKMTLQTDKDFGANYRIIVRDIAGRMVFETEITTDEHHLDISQLSPGTYILSAITPKSLYQTKVVITR